MPEDDHPIWKTLEFDQANIEESRKLLESRGLVVLLERIPSLFDALPREIEAVHRESGQNPYVRKDASGTDTEAWGFILQVYMVQSAGMQFLHAAGHLLRGHSYETFGHARTMIESAGIAYLAKLEPDLGDAYLDLVRRKEFRNRTSSDKILPKSDGLTKDLNDEFSTASSIFHSNFVSIAGRIGTQFTTTNGKIDFSNEMKFHDIDADNPREYLMHAGWLVRTSARVLRLFGAAFSLPDCVWYRRLETFETDVQTRLEALRRELFPGPPDP
jgi:hypothetical protein